MILALPGFAQYVKVAHAAIYIPYLQYHQYAFHLNGRHIDTKSKHYFLMSNRLNGTKILQLLGVGVWKPKCPLGRSWARHVQQLLLWSLFMFR